jgi:endonuclease/exonuclease/phosphatase (EEP) superfamily protein YafD
MLRKIFFYLYLGTAFLLLLSLFNRYHWIPELFVNGRVVMGPIFLFCAMAFFFQKRKLLLYQSLVLSFLIGLEVYSVYLPLDGEGQHQISVLSVNLWSANRQHQRVLDLVKDRDADLVLVMELTPVWYESLQELKVKYPHYLEVVREDNFGIALYSKYPMSGADTLVWSSSNYPSIVSEIAHPEFTFHLVATHPMPPKHARGFQIRNAHFEAMIEYISKQNKPLLLVGDLNASPYSYQFKNLLSSTKLRDSRQGFGVHSTWPAFSFPLAFPIDHIFHSEEFTSLHRSTGPKVGSDHLPIFAVLGFRKME